MKKAHLLPSAAIGALLLNSCTPLAHDPNEKYVLVTANTKVAYWQTAQQGLTHAASELKVKSELVGPDTYDPKDEHAQFQRAIAEKPSGIMVSVADPQALSGDIEQAIAAGIPVITVDSDAPGSKRLFFLGTDNYNAGVLGGELTSKLLNGKGTVVIFTMPNQNNLADRQHGYQSAFEEHPGIKVAQVIDIKGDPTVAFDNAKRIIDDKEKVDAFVCLEAIACPEVGEVVNRENMSGKVIIVAMDTDSRTLSWIQKGVISATIAQKPYTMAYVGLKMLDDIHHHPPASLGANWAQDTYSTLPAFVDTGSTTVDKENIATFLQQSQAHAQSPAQPVTQ
jgi:ribose transport system substrate-binding protein